MLVLNDRNAAIGVSIFFFLLLGGCETVREPRDISGITTFHTSERTEVFFVCEKYYRQNDIKHEHEHIHCDKNKLLNFKFVF